MTSQTLEPSNTQQNISSLYQPVTCYIIYTMNVDWMLVQQFGLIVDINTYSMYMWLLPGEYQHDINL